MAQFQRVETEEREFEEDLEEEGEGGRLLRLERDGEGGGGGGVEIEMRLLGGVEQGVEEGGEGREEEGETSSSSLMAMSWMIRLVNIAVLFSTVTTAEASRGIVVPSLALYNERLGGTSALLSVEVALFSVGRLLATPLLGWLSGRYVSNAHLLSGCLVLCVVGNLFYGLGLELGLVALVFSRLVLGFGTGILGVARAFIALVTSNEERTGFMSLLNAVQFVGFSLTPMLGSLLCGLDFELIGVRVDCLSSPGFLLGLVNAIMLALFLAFFREPKKEDEGGSRTSSSSTSPSTSSETYSQDVVSWKSVWLGPSVFILLNAVVRGSISVLETLGGGMFRETWKDEDDDELEDTGYFFTIIGTVGLASYVVVTLLSKRVSDFVMLVVGLVCIGLGSVLFIGITDADYYRFVVGCGLIWSCGMPLTGTCVVSMCSKIITPSQQGLVMGIITAAGSIGRIIGPLIAALPRVYCFASVLLMVTFSLVISIVLRKRLTTPVNR